MYLPAIVMVGFYFEKRRAFATGIAVCGSGIGGFIFAPLCNALLTAYGWKGATWIIAGITLNGVVMGFLFRPLRSQKAAKRKTKSNKYDVTVGNSCDSDVKKVQKGAEIRGNSEDGGKVGNEGNKEGTLEVNLSANQVSETVDGTDSKKPHFDECIHHEFLRERLKDQKKDIYDSGIDLTSMKSASSTPLGQRKMSHSASFDCLYQISAENKALDGMSSDQKYSGSQKNIFYTEVEDVKQTHPSFQAGFESMTSQPEEQGMASQHNDVIAEDKSGCLRAFSRMCNDTLKLDFGLLLHPVLAVYGISCFLCMAGKIFSCLFLISRGRDVFEVKVEF